MVSRIVRCPRCLLATVRVDVVSWQDGTYVRRSVFVDEPLRCSDGCTLSADAVIRLLLAVDRSPGYQLPLLVEEEAATA